MLLLVSFLLASCGGPHPELRPEGPYWADNDRRDISEPTCREPTALWMTIRRSFFDQLDQLVDLERSGRIIAGNRREAANINSFDEVPNSSWFTNRHHLDPMTTDQIRRGPASTNGPDTTGTWQVQKAVTGSPPELWIEDSRGNNYHLHFDPLGYPELSTGAAVMGNRFFHACGYNVPQETIVLLEPENLVLRDDATLVDHGKRKPLTERRLRKLLGRLNYLPGGRIRALATFELENAKGPFLFTGTRPDDPNDWFPHQHRRELRALRVLASLVNHHDLTDRNTRDDYVTEGGRSFLRHYLTDFDACFGAGDGGPKSVRKGYANYFDLRDIAISLSTLGLKTWAWEHAEDTLVYPSVGYFEAELFRPERYDPVVPNPAMENLTARDAYWGAKLVMSWRDEHLEALVDAGRYSNPAARQYLLRTLIERRDKIGRHWFDNVNPLDYFEWRTGKTGLRLSFVDLMIDYGLDSSEATYRYDLRYGEEVVIAPRTVERSEIVLTRGDLDKAADVFGSTHDPGDSQDHVFVMDLVTSRDGQQSWSPPVRLYWWYLEDKNTFELTGIEHLD